MKRQVLKNGLRLFYSRKKMKIKLKGLFFVLAFWVMNNIGAYDEVYVDKIRYRIYDGNPNTACVEDCHEYKYEENLVIPESICYQDKVYEVTGIGSNSFDDCRKLISVSIPSSVTAIWGAAGAFVSCSALISIDVDENNTEYSSVDGVLFDKEHASIICYPQGRQGDYNIPNSVTSIGYRAFAYCGSLTSVSIPNSVTSIGMEAFRNSGLTSVSISNSVTSIGEDAFYACIGLTSVYIPNSVTTINTRAFLFCSGLTSIDVDEGNAKYSSVDGVLFDKEQVSIICYPRGKQGDYNIPNGVTSIGEYAFSDCIGLTSVYIPNSVTTIGGCAFQECKGLTSIILPNNVKSIGNSAFWECVGLTSVSIPKSVTSIGVYPFTCCRNLTSINVDKDNEVYSSIDGVVFNKDATELMFVPCGMTGIYTIPNSVTKIADYAFTFSEQINGVSIPCSVRSIGEAFGGCPGLKVVYVYGVIPPSLQYNSFSGISSDCVLYVPSGVKSVYEESSAWRIFKNKQGMNIVIQSPEFAEQAPTSLSLVGKYTEEHVKVVETGFEGCGKGNELLLTGLDPQTTYSVSYYAKGENGYCEKDTFCLSTSSLELVTLQPKSVSETCAIVAATTNIIDEETSVGFQWKKYDAPSTLKPSEGYAAIYEGQLEGYVKNLQPAFYYNVRAFYKSSTGNYYYSDWVTFDPSDFSYFEPTVHTYPAQGVTHNSARVKGYVLAGTDDILEQGFMYGVQGQENARLRTVCATDLSGVDMATVFASGQVMTAVLDDLSPCTTYVCRAFVKTAKGLVYGEDMTFMTGEDVTGIESVEPTVSEPTVIGYYDLNGRKYETLQKGLNIIRYSDGSVRKMLMK